MRIIHIVHGNSMGGAQRYALDICRHYAAAGDDVVALTRDAKAIDSQFAAAGVPLRHAPLRDYPDIFSSLILKPMLMAGVPGATVVHVHRYRDALTAILARRLARRPDVRIIVTRHISQPAKDNMLRRFIYRHVDAHIFVSEFSRRQFLATWPHGRYPLDTARLHVAYNSRNTTLSPLPEPQRGAVTAMFHGTLRPGKGLDTLIRAMVLLKDTRLRLRIAGTGDPDYADTLRRLAISLGVMDSIDWNRSLPDPSSLIPTCHFGVLPASEPEAFGMANMEYMAAGRPQICTFNGAQPEYLSPGVEALEVPVSNPRALADAMRRLYSDKELRRQMGEAALLRYNRSLSWPHFISRIDKIYAQT
ncbi:MAG: glycosyltransferase family 4 protein [Muribaculaceae bacterium]|nr:glycosyltransferase family 4 protein [Muribaculaceae bacterium]